MANPNYLFTDTLADALASLGVCHAAITPGSRNTPLAIAIADQSAIPHSVHIDERSAAFFALGAAKLSGLPAVLVCTSGTAAAEYAPAVHEASISRVPLIVLTADRPPELRDVAAPQAIDQRMLYGNAAKWSHELATPDPSLIPYVARIAAQAWTAAMEAPAGPVHINVPLRDPLAPVDRAPVATAPVPSVELSLAIPSTTTLDTIAETLSGKRTLLVAGQSTVPVTALFELAVALGAPILADPLSNLRGRHEHVVSTGDTIARVGALAGTLRPDVVVRFGPPLTSKAFGLWQAAHPEVPQLVVDQGGWREPQPVAPTMIRADIEATATALLDHIDAGADWIDPWRLAEAQIQAVYADLPFPSEPGVARSVAEMVPSDSVLWTASSMPIRDIDLFFAGRSDSLTLLGNRGANGIDGFVSAALGTAAVSDRPVYGLAGDLSLLHDATALITANRLGLDLTIVVVNNDGGGIFHFLPQADHPERFEELLVVPHGQNLADIVGGLGGNHRAVDDAGQLETILAERPKGLHVVEIQTERVANHELHQDLMARAAAALQ